MKRYRFAVGEEIEDKLMRYARFIFEENKKFNITGFKSIEDIFNKLIVESIEPIAGIAVPRGTRFFDIGSGAGVPGIPIGVFFERFEGQLIESNAKKVLFMQRMIDELGIENLSVIGARAEDIARLPDYRESADWLFARAFQSVFTTLEIGAPFLRVSGLLYIYSSTRLEELPEEVLIHAERLGLSFLGSDQHGRYGVSEAGLLLLKQRSTPDEYPRRFAAINREARRVSGATSCSHG